MRPLLLAVVACSFFPQLSLCQNADTSYVRQLHQKASRFWSTHPDSLRYYRDSSFRIAAGIGDAIGIAESFTDLGIYHWIRGEYEQAIHAYDTSNFIFDRIGRQDKKINNLSNLGMVYSRLGAYPKAIEYLLQSLRLAEEFGRDENIPKTLNSLGVAYKNQGNYDQALSTYQDALTMFQKNNSAENIAGTYTNIGSLYAIRLDYKQATLYQSKALLIFDSLHNDKGIVVARNNLSDVMLAEKKYEQALQQRQLALALSQEKNFTSSELSALSGIASIYLEVKRFDDAEKTFERAIRLAMKSQSKVELAKLYRGLAQAYEGRNKSNDALNAYKQYVALKDSLLNEESVRTISNLRTAYDLEKKEASIKLLLKDNEIARLDRNIIVISAAALLMATTLTLVWQSTRARKNKLLVDKQEQLRQTELALHKAELDAAHSRSAELERELHYKNKSLTTYALAMAQKNEMLDEVKETIDVILTRPANEAELFKKLSRLVDHGFTLDKDWDDFKLYFEEVHTDFFNKLRASFPDLSSADLRLCALIRLNMNVKQSAAILRISPDSVKVARHRLRKKLNLQTEDNLSGYIATL